MFWFIVIFLLRINVRVWWWSGYGLVFPSYYVKPNFLSIEKWLHVRISVFFLVILRIKFLYSTVKFPDLVRVLNWENWCLLTCGKIILSLYFLNIRDGWCLFSFSYGFQLFKLWLCLSNYLSFLILWYGDVDSRMFSWPNLYNW